MGYLFVTQLGNLHPVDGLPSKNLHIYPTHV